MGKNSGTMSSMIISFSHALIEMNWFDYSPRGELWIIYEVHQHYEQLMKLPVGNDCSRL